MVNQATSHPTMTHQTLQLVVCGTDTDVGKTVVSALLVQGLQATYWKPIQSGLEDEGDRGRINKLLSLSSERSLPEIYKFKAAVSPHWAAEQEAVAISPNNLNIPKIRKPLVIEMAGGLMVPLTREWLQIDLLKAWKLPLVLVARSGLGTLNHTLLSIEAIRLRKIPLLGLILNGPLHPDNPKTLEQIGGVPIIAELPHLHKITSQALAEQWKQQSINIKLKRLLEVETRDKE